MTVAGIVVDMAFGLSFLGRVGKRYLPRSNKAMHFLKTKDKRVGSLKGDT
jgi:hypothetical protein